MKVTVTGGEISAEEQQAYIDRAIKKYGNHVVAMNIKVDNEHVDLTYEFVDKPFERLRRITGYLVGTMNRWNDAKRSEEHDRVKHGI